MKKRNRLLALLMCAAMASALISCGADTSDDGDNGDVVGGDWRVQGLPMGYGTAQIGNETYNLIGTVHSEDVTIYFDDETQTVFGEALYPEKIEDAARSSFTLSFDDMSADGDSDLRLDITHDDGTTTRLVWFYDTVDGYIYQPELSVIHEGFGDDGGYADEETDAADSSAYIDPYVGIWKFSDSELWLIITAECECSFVDDTYAEIERGVVVADESGIVLHYDESGDVLELTMTVSEDLISPNDLDVFLARVDEVKPAEG